jgi:hypothetical protein
LPNSGIQWLPVKPGLDVRYQAMRHTLYHPIRMAIKIASDLPLFLIVVNFIVGHNLR